SAGLRGRAVAMANSAAAGPCLLARWRKLRRSIPGFIKGVLRRQSEMFLPNREARDYRFWIAEQMRERQLIYTDALEPGLLSVLTPVWNKSPVRYLKILAESISNQNREGACEWVILD